MDEDIWDYPTPGGMPGIGLSKLVEELQPDYIITSRQMYEQMMFLLHGSEENQIKQLSLYKHKPSKHRKQKRKW